MVEREEHGTLPDGTRVAAWALAAGPARVRVSEFGATLLSAVVPDARGRLADVVLGYGALADYAGENPSFYGGTMGPVANRTDRAEVPLAGRVWHLPANDGSRGENNLHTDLTCGLHKLPWHTAEVAGDAVTLHCELADGAYGLPGSRAIAARFSLTEDHGPADEGVTPVARLAVRYEVTSDAPTYVNPTCHAYFNLAGHAAGSVAGHVVSVAADAYLPIREDSVPTGEVRDVTGTLFDLREPRALGEVLAADDEQLRRGRGLDHCLCVRGYVPGGAPRPALRLWEPTSGRTLEVLLTTPGAQLYTGNWLDDARAKDGAAYGPRAGLAFEPELYPDSAHHPEWPWEPCAPNQPYVWEAVYRFGTRG